MGALQQLLGQVEWGALDIMVVDMPPGTGDAQLTMAQKVKLAGAVIVSTPQDIALADARRGVKMFEKTSVPVLGLVENMSFYCCPNCGHRAELFGHGGAAAEAARLGVPFLGEIPLLLDIRTNADAGTPIAASAPGQRGRAGLCGAGGAGLGGGAGAGGGRPADRVRLIVVRDVAALRSAIAARPGTWALVATMGALHAGHVSLVAAGRQRADHIAASIFVNPTQFAAHEDLSRYPRDEAGDLAKLEAAGCDLVWMPSVATMYPTGDGTFIDVAGPTAGYEGTMRPGHFRGMATVVGKLLMQVGPAFSMFGEKDWQQLQVVRRMVTDLHFPVEIVGVPTMREPDGLAMSSRNRFLTPEERSQGAAAVGDIASHGRGAGTGRDGGAGGWRGGVAGGRVRRRLFRPCRWCVAGAGWRWTDAADRGGKAGYRCGCWITWRSADGRAMSPLACGCRATVAIRWHRSWPRWWRG